MSYPVPCLHLSFCVCSAICCDLPFQSHVPIVYVIACSSTCVSYHSFVILSSHVFAINVRVLSPTKFHHSMLCHHNHVDYYLFRNHPVFCQPNQSSILPTVCFLLHRPILLWTYRSLPHCVQRVQAATTSVTYSTVSYPRYIRVDMKWEYYGH